MLKIHKCAVIQAQNLSKLIMEDPRYEVGDKRRMFARKLFPS